MTSPQAAHVLLVLLSPDSISPCLGIGVPDEGLSRKMVWAVPSLQ